MSEVDEKAILAPRYSAEERAGRTPIGFKSSGVARAEAIASHITFRNRVCIFVGIFLIAFAYSLDSILRSAYQASATSDLNSHALLSTINVVKAVISVAAQVRGSLPKHSVPSLTSAISPAQPRSLTSSVAMSCSSFPSSFTPSVTHLRPSSRLDAHTV